MIERRGWRCGCPPRRWRRRPPCWGTYPHFRRPATLHAAPVHAPPACAAVGRGATRSQPQTLRRRPGERRGSSDARGGGCGRGRGGRGEGSCAQRLPLGTGARSRRHAAPPPRPLPQFLFAGAGLAAYGGPSVSRLTAGTSRLARRASASYRSSVWLVGAASRTAAAPANGVAWPVPATRVAWPAVRGRTRRCMRELLPARRGLAGALTRAAPTAGTARRGSSLHACPLLPVHTVDAVGLGRRAGAAAVPARHRRRRPPTARPPPLSPLAP